MVPDTPQPFFSRLLCPLLLWGHGGGMGDGVGEAGAGGGGAVARGQEEAKQREE